MLDGVSISIQGIGVGAQTFRRGLIIALAVLATGAAAVTVIASSHTNQLDVEVSNVNNFDMPGSGGELEAVVYNNDNAYTGQETYSGGESSVTVTVDGIADGDYTVEVYQTPDGGKGFEEYWGSESVSLYDGYEKIDHTRDTQWMSHISINDQSPYDSTPTIVEGESVHIDIRATNSEQWAIDTYVRLFLDRNKDSTHDFESEHGPVTIDSGGDGWFGWDHTPEHTGTYYFYAVVKGTYSQKTRTDQHFWYPAFEVEPNEGDLKVYVEDENGNTESGADVVLYDNDWNELDTKTTNSNGYVKWTGLDPATYNLEAYGPKGAFWGSIQADVQQGEQTTKTLQRKAPWLKDVVFTDKSNGDGTYVVGETINIAPQVYNGESYDKNVRVEIWTDQDQSSPWDDHVTRGPITISAQSDGWFGRDFVPESSGTYYVRVQVESEYSDWAVTDVPGWVESFYVEPDAGDLKACVEDRNGDRVSDAIVKLYDDNWNYQGEKNTNSNGCAKWSGIETGSYNLEAYGPGGSFWGGLGAEVNQGEQTTKTIGRSTPWLETVTIQEQGDGDGTIEEGETVTVSPGAKHLESYGVDTKVQIWIDRDKSSPWDDDVTRGPIRIDPGETGWFGRDFQPPESGTYYVRVKVLADYGGPDWAVTDDPGWTTNFDVGTPESGQIDVRVEHPSGDLVKDSELNARIVYQDGTDSSPYRDPSDPGDGQFTVGNLPPGHDYTVTVYVNDMYAGATQPIGIQDGDQKSATITVHDQGRLTVQAYYDDGQTPLSDATVRVYSHEDSTVWREDTTTEDGQTQALWLMPTTRDGEHYHVKIYKGGAKVGEQDGVQLSGNGDQTVDITTTVSADSPRIVSRDPSSRDLDLQEGSERTFTVEVEDPDGALGDIDWYFSDADCNPIEGGLKKTGNETWRGSASHTFLGGDSAEVGVIVSDEGEIDGQSCDGWSDQASVLWEVTASPAGSFEAHPLASSIGLTESAKGLASFRILDPDGRPVPDAEVSFDPDLGTAQTDRRGIATVAFTLPDVEDKGAIQVDSVSVEGEDRKVQSSSAVQVSETNSVAAFRGGTGLGAEGTFSHIFLEYGRSSTLTVPVRRVEDDTIRESLKYRASSELGGGLQGGVEVITDRVKLASAKAGMGQYGTTQVMLPTEDSRGNRLEFAAAHVAAASPVGVDAANSAWGQLLWEIAGEAAEAYLREATSGEVSTGGGSFWKVGGSIGPEVNLMPTEGPDKQSLQPRFAVTAEASGEGRYGVIDRGSAGVVERQESLMEGGLRVEVPVGTQVLGESNRHVTELMWSDRSEYVRWTKGEKVWPDSFRSTWFIQTETFNKWFGSESASSLDPDSVPRVRFSVEMPVTKDAVSALGLDHESLRNTFGSQLLDPDRYQSVDPISLNQRYRLDGIYDCSRNLGGGVLLGGFGLSLDAENVCEGTVPLERGAVVAGQRYPTVQYDSQSGRELLQEADFPDIDGSTFLDQALNQTDSGDETDKSDFLGLSWGSPVTIYLKDDSGRRFGLVNGSMVREIPGAFGEVHPHGWIVAPRGNYTVHVSGTDPGEYDVGFVAGNESNIVSTSFEGLQTDPGASDAYHVTSEAEVTATFSKDSTAKASVSYIERNGSRHRDSDQLSIQSGETVSVEQRREKDDLVMEVREEQPASILPIDVPILVGLVGAVMLAGVAVYIAPRLRQRSFPGPTKDVEIPRSITPGDDTREVSVPLSLEPFLPDLHTIDVDQLWLTGLRGGAVILGTIAATTVTLALTSSAGALGALVAPFLILAAAGLSGAAVHRWQGRQFTEPKRTALVGLLAAGVFALGILALLPSQPSNAHVASVWNQAALPVALAGALIVFGILEVQSDEEDHETTDTRSRPRASSGIEELETALDDAYELIDEPPQDPEAIRDAVPGLVSRLESAADTDDELASEAIRVADRLRSTSIDQLLTRAEDQLDLAVREIRAGRDPSGPLARAVEAAELGTDLSPGRDVRLEAVGAAASIVESAPPDRLGRAVVTELADLSFKTDEASVVEVAEDRGCRMLAAMLDRSLWDQLAQGEDDVGSRGWSPS